jgi:Fe-S cluster biogenesis protein NfuA
MEHRSLSPQTLAAQALGETDPATGALAPVISLSTNYEQQPDGSYPQGRVYTRADNPTSEHAERLLAALEGGECARQILDAEVNPAIAAHRGHVTVTGADHGWIRIRLEGGCQGCSLAEVTIRQGIEPLLRARLPAITGLIGTTDHEAGTDPFFSPEKR